MSSERVWRTSSYSGTQGGNCVQVAAHDGLMLVRDTKDHGEGHIHRFPAAKWRTFVAAVSSGEFGLDDPGRMP